MRPKRVLLCVACGSIVFLVGAAVLLYFATSDPSFRRKPFAAKKWQEGNARDRGEMVEDLLAKDLLNGKSEEQVLALLGSADHGTRRTKDFDLCYEVDVGMRFGFRPWWYVLCVCFDSSTDKVTAAYCDD